MSDKWGLEDTPFERAFKWTLADVETAKAFLPHLNGRKLAVQAGGNVGVYPCMLAEHFEEVVTFEPDWNNFVLLTRNLGRRERFNVEACNSALGEERKYVSLIRSTDNAGRHKVNPKHRDDEVLMVTLDSLDLPACDLIWLDIEGYELNALKGAKKTIDKFKPAIIVEIDRAVGKKTTSPVPFLATMGYREIMSIKHDFLFRY